jgi:hypothetical protein
MKSINLMKSFGSNASFWFALGLAALLICGCQAKPAPLSPGAVTFKHEIKDCFSKLAEALKESVAHRDIPAINAVLEKIESPAVKLCRLCPFKIGILNQYGEGLASYPPQAVNNMQNYSSYDLVATTINSKKIQHQRFYLQDGSELYIICAPLLKDETLIGLVAIAVSSADANTKWGLTEKDFMTLNFNN